MDALMPTEKDHDIDNILGNINAIASTSGGTWLSTHLAYSKDFESQFESKAGRDTYVTNGYLGELRRIFESLGVDGDGQIKLPSGHESTNTLLKAAAAAINGIKDTVGSAQWALPAKNILDTALFTASMAADTINKSGLSWRGFIDNYVNKPQSIHSSLDQKLTAPRNEWANNIDLIIGASMQTSPVVLGRTSGFAPSTVLTGITHLETTSSQLHYTPISLISRAGKENSLPTTSALLTAGKITTSYSEEWLGIDLGRSVHSNVIDQLANHLSIADASAISSAAFAPLTGVDTFSQNLPKLVQELTRPLRNELAVLFKDLAPLATLSNNTLSRLNAPPSWSAKSAKEQAAIRLADSCYSDNTTVANALRDIQDQYGTTSPFVLTVFANSYEPTDPLTGLNKRLRIGPEPQDLSNYGVSSEVGYLFGQSQGNGKLDGDIITHFNSPPGLPIFTPSPQVFDPSAWHGKHRPDWSSTKGNLKLSYFELDVVTTNNETFGIKGGQAGKVHLFNAINPDAYVFPLNFKHLDEYAKTYSFVRDAVADPNANSALRTALGF